MLSVRQAVRVCLFAAMAGAMAMAQGKPKPSTKPQNESQSAASATKASPQRPAPQPAAPDLHKQKTLYVVGYAHLDTEWRWEYPQVIDEYLSKTLRNNFALFEKYPHYIFNFTGANRYRFFKEYYPDDFARLKRYVAQGRWFPAGSSMEEGDVNAPNAEFIIREVLYGNTWFRREFGVASDEYMLPDCFGFPASLPSILAHAGVKGFSTQKLSAAWQPAPRVGGPNSPEKTPEGIPFNVGVWYGPDGKSVIAALNPLTYGSSVTYDLSKAPPQEPPPATPPPNFRRLPMENWPKRIDIDGDLTGIFADYHYVGTGDTGGSPTENSVKLMEAIVTKGEYPLPAPGHQAWEPGPMVRVGDGPVHVEWSRADQMFRDILRCCNTDKLPTYKGDLELINHSAGSLTSEAYHKRWNRENELLGSAAEHASVAAEWLGGRAYPLQRINDAWTLVMGGHFHDNLAGTSTPKAYEFTWNDDVVALNQFAGVLTSATDAIASAMDTQAKGTPIVVYNPLNVARQDVVEATVALPAGTQSVQVSGPKGTPVAAQVIGSDAGGVKILFVADVPAMGFAVYDAQPGTAQAESSLKVSESGLENARYRVQIDANGDVSSIFDKKLDKELLSAPIRLAVITDNPSRYPAWNMDWEDVSKPPRSYIGGPAKVRVVENGPVRVAVEIARDGEDSHFVQQVRLSAGDAGNRVEFSNAIDWKGKDGTLKAVFPLSASNPNATYNWDIGTVERPNENERQFEVASHQWIDLTDKSGAYGTTILTDDKNGSDKTNDNTIRLTLIRTPGTRGGYPDQGTMDWGHHEFVFGLAGHANDWRAAQTDWQAYRLNQPLIAFESPKHGGALGRQFALMNVSSDRVRVLALKKAEAGDEYIVRLVELDGKAQPDVTIKFAGPIASAREVNGQEQPVGAAKISAGALVTSFTAYQPRTFAVKLAAANAKAAPLASQPVTLPYDASVATHTGKPGEGCFDCNLNAINAQQGRAIPAELLPNSIDFAGIRFHLAPAGTGKPNAVTATGQTINLPAGNHNRMYVLAASYGDDPRVTFTVGDRPQQVTMENWGGYVGQWDARGWDIKEEQVPLVRGTPVAAIGAPQTRTVRNYTFNGKITPGFIKRADIAWYTDHRHASDGSNEAYAYSYLFGYEFDLPPGAKAVKLPDNPSVRILAITVSTGGEPVRPAKPLYDALERAGAGQ